MSTSHRRHAGPSQLWRLVLFAVLATTIFVGEDLLQAWMIPSDAAQLGVSQLENSDAAAERLRAFEWARQALPIATWTAVALAACAVSVPLPRPWLRRLRRAFA